MSSAPVGHRPIHAALAAVMADVRAVGKDGRNTQANYSFRGIDGCLNAIGPALRTHGVVILPELEQLDESTVEVGRNLTRMGHVTIRVRYTFVGPAGDSLSVCVPGEAFDSGDKAISKAMSVALRTALIQTFALPTDQPDPDETTYELSTPPPPPPPMTQEQQLQVAEALAALDSDQSDAVKKWWKAQRFPKADRLTAEQADAVLAHLADQPADTPDDARSES